MAKDDLITNILLVFALLLTVDVIFFIMIYNNTVFVTTTQKINNIMNMLMNISEQIEINSLILNISEQKHI